MNLLILGFIRPEYDYVSAESLVRDITIDIEVAKRSLERDGWREWAEDEWLLKGLGERSGIEGEG
jgi:riboflavin kinase